MTVNSPNTALRLRATAAQNSAVGTAAAAVSKPVQNGDRELTEQLNIDVRERYIKGTREIYFHIFYGDLAH